MQGIRKKINLLNEGTGIRFNLKPQRKSILKSKQIKVFLGLLTMLFLASLSFTIGGMMLDFLDFRERVAPEEAGRRSAQSQKDSAKVADSRDSGETSPSNVATGVTAFNERPKVSEQKEMKDAESLEANLDGLDENGEAEEVPEVAYFVRYALFLNAENAEAYSAKLRQLSLMAEVLEALYPLPSYTIKAGPFVNPNSRKVAQKELKKLGVALTPFLEQKYLVSKPVWKKSKALDIQKKLLSLGVSTELSMERSPKTVFKVVSSGFDEEQEAKEYAEIAKEDGLKVIVEVGEKIDKPEEIVEDGGEVGEEFGEELEESEESGEKPEENGEEQQN